MDIYSYIMGSVLISATLIAGILLYFCPPKKINNWYGIRTKITSTNQETWDYGHKICAITLLIYSFFSILAYTLILFFAKDFLSENYYFRMIFALIFALAGVAIAGIITQVKTKKIANKDNVETKK